MDDQSLDFGFSNQWMIIFFVCNPIEGQIGPMIYWIKGGSMGFPGFWGDKPLRIHGMGIPGLVMTNTSPW